MTTNKDSVSSTALASGPGYGHHPLLHQGRARFYCSLRETKELVSLLEHDRENLICELERLRNYSWALYHAYDKAVGELQQGKSQQWSGR
ncbi:hypothetical protein N7497_003706 [Penicillium chrysogenum]|nr:hypothetical protein N7497_003706 [Penicillium chrysogenum]